MFHDLRDWLDQAKNIGELTVINGSELAEMGAINQTTAKNEGPAILFDNIKGYAAGYRMAMNLVSNIKTVNMSLGLPTDWTIKQTVEHLSKRFGEWGQEAAKFPPLFVEKAPILENVIEGDDIDLSIFPVPRWHDEDGGPYIGTADSVITRDRKTGFVNMGSYRSPLLDSRTVGVYIVPGHQGRLHLEKYFEHGEPCPMVMVFGTDPLSFMISSMEIPEDISEPNLIGAIRGAPITMIKGKITGLPIPATAEIAVEGFVYPNQTRDEGPFGEWPGYYAGGVAKHPFLKPAALYYRNNPILTGSPPAKGSWCDFTFFRSVLRSGILYNELRAANVPGIKGVWLPQLGGSRHFVVVAIEQRFAGHATMAGVIATQTRASACQGRYTVVVDDDIDIYDIEDVMWAVCTRSYPQEIDFLKKTWTSNSDPTLPKPAASLTTSRAIIYAVRPWEWKNEFPKVNMVPVETRRKAFDKYKELFNGRWTQL